MISEQLGLSIKKSVLNSSSPNKVSPASTIRKTAKNYLALGNIAQDLHIANLNFITYVNFYGGKARDKPDGQVLSEDERSRKFGVMREKFLGSLISKDSKDGLSQHRGKSLFAIQHYLRKKFTRRFERKVNAKVLRQLRKITIVRKYFSFKRQVLKALENVLSRFNFKKMFLEWAKDQWKNISKSLKPFFKKVFGKFGEMGLKTALKGALKTGLRAIPFLGWILVLYDGISESINAYNKDPNANIFKAFFVGVIDGFTLGLFDKDDIGKFLDRLADWYLGQFKLLFNIIDKTINFISDKLGKVFSKLLNKGKSVADDLKDFFKPGEYLDEMTDRNKALATQQAEDDKRMKYIQYLSDQIIVKRGEINRLKIEIQALELEEEQAVLSPAAQQKDEQQAEFEKKNEELRLLEKEKEAGYSGDDPTIRKRLGLPPKSYAKRKDEEKQEEKKQRDEQLTQLAQNVESKGYQRGEEVGKVAAVGKTTLTPTPSAPPKGLSPQKMKELEVPKTVKDIIIKASYKVGVDDSIMLAMAKQESGFNPNAGAKGTSAKGLYQFLDKTWKSMVARYQSEYPVLKKGQLDPEASAIAGALYIKENAKILQAKNIPVTGTSIYAAHFLGVSGAATLLGAKATEIAAKLLPDAAKSNKSIFFKTDPKTNKPDLNSPRTVADVISILYGKVGQVAEQYAAIKNADDTKLAMTQGKSVGGYDVGSFVAREPDTGSKIIYKSEEISLGHREQLKPYDYDIINAPRTTNAQISKNTTSIVKNKRGVDYDMLIERIS
jgi:hypothetical protein